MIEVDCVWGQWESSSCSTTCGNGTKHLMRSIIRNALNGGENCSGPAYQTAACNYAECPGNTFMKSNSNPYTLKSNTYLFHPV